MAYTTINKSTDYFSSNLYTGTGSALTVTTGHQSDFIWIKQRTTVRPHCLFDSVNSSNFAGGNSKYLVSNTTANLTSNNATQITANSSTGFSIGTDNSDQINNNGDTAVAWSWKANGQGSANTDGTINTTYTSADTTSGFSISTYTGTGSAGTIGHGLGAKPAMIIAKRLTGSAEAWTVYHQSLDASAPQDKYLHLNSTDAVMDSAGMWNDTAPTTSVFSVGSTGVTNGSGGTFVAYCFAEKQGFSKFGSYTGAGGGGQPFIYTGFKPAFIITRNVTSAVDWGMFDNKRNEYNVVQNVLLPNNSAAETTGTAKYFDFLSNGFKVKNDSLQYNGTNEKHIYMAFAEAPLVGSNNVPCTAR